MGRPVVSMRYGSGFYSTGNSINKIGTIGDRGNLLNFIGLRRISFRAS